MLDLISRAMDFCGQHSVAAVLVSSVLFDIYLVVMCHVVKRWEKQQKDSREDKAEKQAL